MNNIAVDDHADGKTLRPTLAECYKLFLEPLTDCLCDETEIIIVPNRCLFRVPFAALEDGDHEIQAKPLSRARKKAERIGKQLQVLPLLEEKATK